MLLAIRFRRSNHIDEKGPRASETGELHTGNK
jgi:hypothetical protein